MAPTAVGMPRRRRTDGQRAHRERAKTGSRCGRQAASSRSRCPRRRPISCANAGAVRRSRRISRRGDSREGSRVRRSDYCGSGIGRATWCAVGSSGRARAEGAARRGRSQGPGGRGAAFGSAGRTSCRTGDVRSAEESRGNPGRGCRERRAGGRTEGDRHRRTCHSGDAADRGDASGGPVSPRCRICTCRSPPPLTAS